MKILQINSFGNLSTGRIAVDLIKMLVVSGQEGVLAYARNTTEQNVPCIKIGTDLDVKVHGLMTRLTDQTGFFSSKATVRLIQHIKEYGPDIIHLHNLHGYYLNIDILFHFLQGYGRPVVWTLHDCWAFTGHCCYYSIAQCERWKTGCYHCPQKASYPASIGTDHSRWNYKKKKELFTKVENMTLVAVSQWLAGEVKQSFLKDYPLKMIYNGIDLNVFKPTESDFREKWGLKNKKIILGVASTWSVRKGLNDFISLSQMLDNRHQVVLVGVNNKEKANLPDHIIGITKTDSVQELTEIYTAADVFLNASVEETFGLPTVEAMACGTPVIVYDSTALPEVVSRSGGYIVKPHDLREIIRILEQDIGRVKMEADIRAFSRQVMTENYLKVYEHILHKGN